MAAASLALLQDAGYVVREMHQAVAEAAQQYEAAGPGALKAAGVLPTACRPALAGWPAQRAAMRQLGISLKAIEALQCSLLEMAGLYTL